MDSRQLESKSQATSSTNFRGPCGARYPKLLGVPLTPYNDEQKFTLEPGASKGSLFFIQTHSSSRRLGGRYIVVSQGELRKWP